MYRFTSDEAIRVPFADAEQDSTLLLQETGRRLSSRSIRTQDGAVIGIANYVIDTLR